ncbi:MAG: metal ABC transporter permease [Syntrophomonadaceae bacterium]|nr:metal ABC transporter permease [Syntrophomonadaceae bacterium]
MDSWYYLLDVLLPFNWMSHLFMKNALLAILLVTPLFGMLGTMVVSNRMAFFSDALGHGAFTGIALGALLGIIKPIWAATIFSVLFAMVITVIKNKSQSSTDTIIGVFSSTAIAAGLVILSYGGSFNKYSSYLIGDLLSITPAEILMLGIMFLIVTGLWMLTYNRLLLVSLNQSLAASKGVDTLLVEIMFTSVVAVVVTVTIQWVGLLIINSLLVLPAAAARNVTQNTRQYHLFAVLTAIVSGITGLVLSYFGNTATGATIVLVAAVIFFATLLLRGRFSA